MQALTIEQTPKTPSIIFDSTSGILEIKGRSIPENALAFYKPIKEFVAAYIKSPQPITKVDIQLEYFNTSSSKCILDFFKQLEKINQAQYKIVINWCYESDDDDILESGEYYQEIIKIPFNMVAVVA
jgi:SiaC family regulatory phosphoprotein